MYRMTIPMGPVGPDLPRHENCAPFFSWIVGYKSNHKLEDILIYDIYIYIYMWYIEIYYILNIYDIWYILYWILISYYFPLFASAMPLYATILVMKSLHSNDVNQVFSPNQQTYFLDKSKHNVILLSFVIRDSSDLFVCHYIFFSP